MKRVASVGARIALAMSLSGAMMISSGIIPILRVAPAAAASCTTPVQVSLYPSGWAAVARWNAANCNIRAWGASTHLNQLKYSGTYGSGVWYAAGVLDRTDNRLIEANSVLDWLPSFGWDGMPHVQCASGTGLQAEFIHDTLSPNGRGGYTVIAEARNYSSLVAC